MTPARYKTRLTELLDIRHPILYGGPMYLVDANYVAVAAEARLAGAAAAE